LSGAESCGSASAPSRRTRKPGGGAGLPSGSMRSRSW